MKHVFILSTGRSGSTLLQGVLNSAPGVLVRGENLNFLNYIRVALAEMEAKLATMPNHRVDPARYIPETERNAFFGMDAFLSPTRDAALATLMETLLLNGTDRDAVDMIGFKEIRYFEIEEDERADLLAFMARLFPQAHFLMLTRDAEQVAQSAWYRRMAQDALKQRITEFYVSAWDQLGALGVSRHRIDYADVVANGDALEALHDGLGIGYSKDRVAEVLQVNHSFMPNKNNTLNTAQP